MSTRSESSLKHRYKCGYIQHDDPTVHQIHRKRLNYWVVINMQPRWYIYNGLRRDTFHDVRESSSVKSLKAQSHVLVVESPWSRAASAGWKHGQLNTSACPNCRNMVINFWFYQAIETPRIMCRLRDKPTRSISDLK